MSIRRIRTMLVAVTLLGAASMATTVEASIIVGTEIKFNNREGSTGGGEFGVALWADPSNDLFRSFCVQVNRYLNFSGKFVVSGINTFSMNDGNPLSAKTAALFQEFWNGSTDFFGSGVTYDYTPGTAQHISNANSLQKAIWHFQQQQGYTDYNTLGAGAQAFVDAANAYVGSGTDVGNVRILNIEWPDGRDGQDQLYVIPEPISIVVWSCLGIVGMLFVKRGRTGCSTR